MPRLHAQAGFTLPELLVTILVIGALTALALPAFLGQRAKGQDADAKSDARNAATVLHACFQERDETFVGCTLAGSGLPAGSGPGQVALDDATAAGYRLVARSGSGNRFTIEFADGRTSRTCTTAGGTARGGCRGVDATW